MKNKKWIILCCAAVLILAGGAYLLFGRGGESGEKTPVLPLLQALENALTDKEGWIAYTADDLSDIMGITPDLYTEAVFLASSDSLSGREAIALRAKDAASLKTVTDALDNYLAQRKEETRNYLPEAYRLQSDAKVETKGLTAALIIGAQSAAETKALLAGE